MPKSLRPEPPKRLVLHFSPTPGEGNRIATALSETHGRRDLQVVHITTPKAILPDLAQRVEAITLSFPNAAEAVPFLQAVLKHRANVPAMGVFQNPDGVHHLKLHYSLKTALTPPELEPHDVDPLEALAKEVHLRLVRKKA